MGYFNYKRVAEGYAQHRPFFHPTVMNLIWQHLDLNDKFSTGLDVGCGAGRSTLGLAQITQNVIGIDAAIEMCAAAKRYNLHSGGYACAPAETLPFNRHCFDVITVCGAINWIDRTRFFTEVRRVLKPAGWLLIYDHGITDQMVGNSAYTQWFQNQYLRRYPKPPRNETPITAREAANYGFQFSRQNYSHQLHWQRATLVEYLLTQSNVINVVEMGQEKLETARKWLHASLTPIFQKYQTGSIQFEGYIEYLQKNLPCRQV